MTKNILSLTLSGHGFSGVVCIDGEIVAATSLERLTRIKNDILLPFSKTDLETFGWKNDPDIYRKNIDLPFDFENDYSFVDLSKNEKFKLMLDYLLKAGRLELKDIDCVVHTYRHSKSVEAYFKRYCPNAVFLSPEEHHLLHACQAFLSSPFEESAIMIVDGQGVPLARTDGDQLSGCLAYGKGITIDMMVDLPVKYSLGGLYASFTQNLGFKTNEEGKTMGLAPYGGPKYYEILKKDLKLNTSEFNLRNIKGLISRGFLPRDILYSLPKVGKFLKDFPKKDKNEEFTSRHKDLAYAVQKITEDVMVHLANWIHKRTGSENLCIAGGVGLNCVANYQVLIRSNFKNVYVHPNPGDNGMAVGQALYAYHLVGNNPRKYIAKTDSLGIDYSEDRIRQAVNRLNDNSGLIIKEYKVLPDMYLDMAKGIESGKITSWFQGRSEFGPRALGNRSILADPRRADMKDVLNSRVKFRESFRPFTPSVLAERSNEFFELEMESPYMLMAAYVRQGKGELVPAITHADNTARVQTVTRDVNERYYDLIKAFEGLTGIPMVLDTSFNVAGEPIVETPEDAIRCFQSTDIDMLCIDRFIITKKRHR